MLWVGWAGAGQARRRPFAAEGCPHARLAYHLWLTGANVLVRSEETYVLAGGEGSHKGYGPEGEGLGGGPPWLMRTVFLM
jgi:hypothetical protein